MPDVAYTPFGWQDKRAGGTPQNAANLEAFGEHLHDQAQAVAAGGITLGAARVTSVANITSTTIVDVPGAVVPDVVISGIRPVIFELSADLAKCNAAFGGGFYLVRDATLMGAIGTVLGAQLTPLHRKRYFAAGEIPAGTYDFKLQAKTFDGAQPLQVTAGNGTGSNNSPLLFLITEG